MRVRSERFRQAALARLEPLRGTWIHAAAVRDLREKTELVDAGYRTWLARLLPYLLDRAGPGSRAVLDFGCGTGELTVLMNAAGFDARGIDLHRDHLALARLLAGENGLDGDRFVEGRAGTLPFRDGEFGVVTLLSVLEHVDDDALARLLPELRRVARLVFVLVPNRLMIRDDHTGLYFVPWLPRAVAERYVRLRGRRYRYGISRSGTWDVHYRTLRRIGRTFGDAGFAMEFPPDSLVYPPLDAVRPIRRLGKRLGRWRVALPHPYSLLRPGQPRQAYHPYLNLIFRPMSGGGGA
jgi:SAM-dependent methyltransferase